MTYACTTELKSPDPRCNISDLRVGDLAVVVDAAGSMKVGDILLGVYGPGVVTLNRPESTYSGRGSSSSFNLRRLTPGESVTLAVTS